MVMIRTDGTPIRSELEQSLLASLVEHGMAGEEMRLRRVAWKAELEELYGKGPEDQIARLMHIAEVYITASKQAQGATEEELMSVAREELYDASDMADQMSANRDKRLATLGTSLREEINQRINNL